MRAQILPMRARKDQSCVLRSACYRHCLSAKCWTLCMRRVVCCATREATQHCSRTGARRRFVSQNIVSEAPKQLFA